MFGRIQNIYLILSVLFLGASFLFDVASLQMDTPLLISILGLVDQVKHNLDPMPLFFYIPVALLVISLGLALASLFVHSRVKQQHKIVSVLFLASLALVATSFLGVKNIATEFGQSENKVSYLIGAFLPVCALAFNILALRSVKKDVNLLKSIDRIR